MNPSSDETIRYYDEHVDQYVHSTVEVDMKALHEPFLELLPEGGRILDAGCGSGRDTKAFLDLGYEVLAIDGSASMVEATIRLTGETAYQTLFQEIDYENEFDGIWACASLLHLPRQKIGSVFARCFRALRQGGIGFMSFKEGEGERSDSGRHFTDFTVEKLDEFLADETDSAVLRIWGTDDLRPGRTQRWVNALVKK